MIWNPLTSGYEKWYWYADNTHDYDGWYDQFTGEIAFETVHPDGLEPGSAVWFLSHANSKGGPAAFSGAVEGAATYTITITRGNYNLFNNPYPVAFKFNDLDNIDWSKAISGGAFANSDQIKIWNPVTSGYENWYWYADSTHAWDGWYDEGTGEIPFETVHPDGLPAGTPVWYLAKGTLGETFDVTFKSPLK